MPNHKDTKEAYKCALCEADITSCEICEDCAKETQNDYFGYILDNCGRDYGDRND